MSICAMCGGSTAAPNFAKTVDPHNQPYGTILGNPPPPVNRMQGNTCIPIQMCLPQMANPQPPCDNRMGGSRGSGGGGGSGGAKSLNAIVNVPRDPPKTCPHFVCEPCPPPPPTKVWLIKSSPMPQKLTPIGVISRCKEFDLIGGKIVGGCTCGRRNGLGGDMCPRVSCQNNPGCTMQPPRCWPQIPDPEPTPPPPPKQDMICLPIELVYYDPCSQQK